MTGPDYFDIAHIPQGDTARCCRCDSTLILRAWVRQKPGAPTQLEIACLPCSEAIEREEAARERTA